MKVILVGHPGSQHIVPVSRFLTEKYLPSDWEVSYLNYTGEITGWSTFVTDHLRMIADDQVIFALDDYLIADYVRITLAEATKWLSQPGVRCVKLCESSKAEHDEYPVTTQYTIWDRRMLIEILGKVKTPWEFELTGSARFIETGCRAIHQPCMKYNTSSALSGRWSGADFKGVPAGDMDEMDRLGIIDRPVAPPSSKQIIEMFQKTGTLLTPAKKRKAVVFGGSGYLGTALVSRLLTRSDVDVVAMARNEGNLVALKEKFPQIKIMVGDISDAWSVKSAMVDADEVYLLSAMKHVGLAETEANACVLTNIVGTMNVINESLSVKPSVLMFISSDKAASGNGVYGGSKKIGERLMAEAERMNKDTKYRVIRYGNVWNSTGSISTKWKPKMERGEEVIITDPEASRFFWTVDEAVDLIFECMDKSKDASPFIPTMKAVKMGVVLEAMMDVYGMSPVKTIGLQPGENKVETTDGVIFSDQCEQFTAEEFKRKFLSSPAFNTDVLNKRLNEIKVNKSESHHYHPKISAILITRENEYPQRVLERLDLPDPFFDEILVVRNCDSIYKRYLAAAKARNSLIYIQDDDVMVNYQELFKKYNGQITNAMTEPFIEKYKDSGCTLVGWGAFFPKSMLSCFDKYIAKYGSDDLHLAREADRIFTALNPGWNIVTLRHEDLPSASTPDRMGYQPEHYKSAAEAIAKALSIT